ncbi:MAG: hypothetical protein NZ873_00680 [Crenarchaeota archaeon]|nr:hypothetical protein [Thermoproteota archaeon]MDW8033684.1 hypothetical protein [Nitrososphaerota archaeon]
MKNVSSESEEFLEPIGRIGIVGWNFRKVLVFFLSKFLRNHKIILLDLSDEFSCIARLSGAKYYSVFEHSINPIKPPSSERVEQYVESIVEIFDYCFGMINMKNIIAKALINNISSSETTIPEIISKLDFETAEGGLSIYSPLEPFTFGTLRKVFGRREELDFNEALETGIVFDLSVLPTASSKTLGVLTILNKLSHMVSKHPTVLVITYPSIVWPKGRRCDAAKLYVEQVLTDNLERRGFMIIFAEKTFSELSEKIVHELDNIIFSPPSEALDPWNPWSLYTRLEREIVDSPAVILNRRGEVRSIVIPSNVMMKPLDKEEREKLKPNIRIFKESDWLKEVLGEDYEHGLRVISMIKELGGKAVLNRLIEEIRSTIGAGGLKALAALLRHGCLRQVHEGDNQYIFLSRGDWE